MVSTRDRLKQTKEKLVSPLKFHRKPNSKKNDDLEMDDPNERITVLETTVSTLTSTVGELVEQLRLTNLVLGSILVNRRSRSKKKGVMEVDGDEDVPNDKKDDKYKSGYKANWKFDQKGESKGEGYSFKGTICSHCKANGHSSDRCWKLHPELRPKEEKGKKEKRALAAAIAYIRIALWLWPIGCSKISIIQIIGFWTAKIFPVVKNQHLLLCTLLIGNSLAMEILPQALCTRYGMKVGATTAPFVRVLLFLFFPVAYPISKVLDWMLGKGHAVLLRRAELKTFVNFHGNEMVGKKKLGSRQPTQGDRLRDLEEKMEEFRVNTENSIGEFKTQTDQTLKSILLAILSQGGLEMWFTGSMVGLRGRGVPLGSFMGDARRGGLSLISLESFGRGMALSTKDNNEREFNAEGVSFTSNSFDGLNVQDVGSEDKFAYSNIRETPTLATRGEFLSARAAGTTATIVTVTAAATPTAIITTVNTTFATTATAAIVTTVSATSVAAATGTATAATAATTTAAAATTAASNDCQLTDQGYCERPTLGQGSNKLGTTPFFSGSRERTSYDYREGPVHQQQFGTGDWQYQRNSTTPLNQWGIANYIPPRPNRVPIPCDTRNTGTGFQQSQWAPRNPFADEHTFWGDNESGNGHGFNDRYGFQDRRGRGRGVHPANSGTRFQNDGYQGEPGLGYARVLAFKRCGDSRAVTLIEMKLTGYTLNWWEGVQQLQETIKGDYITDWDTMRRELMARFIPENYEEESFAKLQNLRQTRNQSVNDYASDFYLFSSRVVLSETEAQRISQFKLGLTKRL
ncbi:hypothetical protein GIB67_042760 [Kingdonia uniflora]|uniref:CNNM transmembrane domain-containing protein n=1 Tax=Kingdonia uniflora TaxID=39325 RepID=A0A7J7L0X9_9MAGN|nr:hypothetical protein GIB67_042760 [Kingdonia uniflora]